ncbi:MAG: response regulator [Thiogranum sp.]|jgi:two-component system response regulator
MVLIIEDNDSDAALMQRILAKRVSPGDIHRAGNGDEAFDLLQHWDGDPPRLVLLDLDLPGLSGLEVLKRLRASPATRHVPVVVIGSPADGDDVARSYDLGANSFISKAVETEQFEFAIEHIAPYWLELNQAYVLPGANR